MLLYQVEIYQIENFASWDAYVLQHRSGRYFHLSGWKTVIEQAYGRPTYYWVCRDSGGHIVGLLPTVHIKHFLFGNALVSMPYLDGGGILADNPEICQRMVQEAIELAVARNIPQIELRHFDAEQGAGNSSLEELVSDKVQMMVPLLESSELLLKGFQNKNKIRTVIRKAEKLGLRFEWGGSEKLDDFYKVFAFNMRDLGTPVHSRAFFEWVWRVFHDYCRVGIVYLESRPIASGIIFCHCDIVSFPFGGSLRSHNHLNPFPFLVWKFLQLGCDQGYKFFDFGRSSIHSGPYKFKERWGAQPQALHWQYVKLGRGKNIIESRGKFSIFSKIWQKLPIPITNLIGPTLRRYISL
jgi:serine/alanine adding enzyme